MATMKGKGESFDRESQVTLKDIGDAAVTAAGTTNETALSLKTLVDAYWDNNEIPDEGFSAILNVSAADAASTDEEYVVTYEVDTDSAFTSSDSQVWLTAWQEDSSGSPDYVDETADLNDAGTNDVALFPAGAGGDDAFYFGLDRRFSSIAFTTGTAGTGTYTVQWHYWDGSSWTAVPGLTDGTTGFKTAGAENVTFDMPTDWEAVAVNGVTRFYIRAQRDGGTVTADPLGTVATANEVAGKEVGRVVLDRDTAVGKYKVLLDGDTITSLYPAVTYIRSTAILGGSTPSLTYSSYLTNPTH